MGIITVTSLVSLSGKQQASGSRDGYSQLIKTQWSLLYWPHGMVCERNALML